MSEEWWGEVESLIQGRLKLYPFPGGILAEAISKHDTFWHVVST